MRKADDGANEHEEDSELGVHLITPNNTYITLVYFLLHLPSLKLPHCMFNHNLASK